MPLSKLTTVDLTHTASQEEEQEGYKTQEGYKHKKNHDLISDSSDTSDDEEQLQVYKIISFSL
jgi:hypothetical protein